MPFLRLFLPHCRLCFFLIAAACTDSTQNQPRQTGVIPDSVLNAAADSLYVLGERARKRRKYDSAVDYHQRALSLREQRKQQDARLAYSYWRIGRALDDQVKLEAANRWLDKALAVADTSYIEFDSLVGIYLKAAEVKSEMLNYASAMSLIAHTLQLVRQHEPIDNGQLAQCYLAMSRAQGSNGNFEESLTSLQTGFRYLPPDVSKRVLAYWTFAIALSHSGLGNIDSALFYFDRSLALRLASSGPFSEEVAGVYLNKSGVFRTRRQYDSALHYQRRIVTIRRKLLGEKDVYTAGAYEGLGDTFHEMGLYDSAIVYRQRQLQSHIRAFNNPDVRVNPKPLEEEITMDLVDYLIDKASTLRAIFMSDTTSWSSLVLSLKTYRLADSVYAVYQENLPFDELALSQMNAAPVPYVTMLEVASRLHHKTGDRMYLETALQVMERSKAVVLKNALSRARSYEELGLPEHLAIREKELLQQRSSLVQLLGSDPGNQDTRDSLNEEIFNVDRRYNQLKIAIDREQPNYLRLKYGSNMNLARLQKIMTRDGGLWIDYLWGDDKLFVLSIGPTTVKLREVPITEELLHRIRSTATAVQQFDETSYTSESFNKFAGDSYFLYQSLVEPALAGQKADRLVIAPSGLLTVLPFESLIATLPPPGGVDYRLDYLVNRFDISYEYSSSFLEQRVTDRHGDRLLAVGFAAGEGEEDRKDDLPGSREELAAIKSVMQNSNNRFLLAAEASEDEFKSNAEQFNLLHLAVHGIGDTINSMKSHLLFRSKGASEEDGKLYAHELYTLNLRNVDMAVLSACESGVGKIQPGEGVMSMARGFRYAGCSSLIISLWKINDKRSAEIMSRFYAAIADGASIDKALADAKRNYLRDVNMLNSHPAFWAAFLSVGDPTPIDLSLRSSAIYLWAISGGAVLFLVWLGVRKRESRLKTQTHRSHAS